MDDVQEFNEEFLRYWLSVRVMNLVQVEFVLSGGRGSRNIISIEEWNRNQCGCEREITDISLRVCR